MNRILLLGATGSIGLQTLDVIVKNSTELSVCGLVAWHSSKELRNIADKFGVEFCLAVAEEKDKYEARKKTIEKINSDDVDVVVNAVSGEAGLIYSYECLKAKKRLALANKESLVVGGDLIMPLAKNLSEEFNMPMLLPIDSEHGAIFQCLIGENRSEINKLWITASGGPFRGSSKDDLKKITVKEALNHPTWNMGPKITIDSATLMNKGLEVIEAHHLFNIDYDDIYVLVHPQSVVHSMVEFCDGSVKAHLGVTNMKIPIQFALSYPSRWKSPVDPLDFWKLKSLEFDKPDIDTFKCLRLAYIAGKAGGTLPCVMNAANEIAVQAFLNRKCNFLNIADVVEATMNEYMDSCSRKPQIAESIEHLEDVDIWSRKYTAKLLKIDQV